MKSRQLRVRPHNDDDRLCVVEVAAYMGSVKDDFDTPLMDEVCMWNDLPEALSRAVAKLLTE